MKTLLFVALCMFSLMGWAQEKNVEKPVIKVKYVDSYESALEEAVRTNKPIFFNCYADWAVPCHGMDEVVFSNAEFAEWLNEHFVCLCLDVVSSQNQYLVEKYNIHFFAHFLILDSQGNLIHRIVGGAKLPEFKDWVARGLDSRRNLVGMNQRYDQGERDVLFLRDYIDVLGCANEGDKQKQVVKEYVQKIDTSDLLKKNNWNIFYKVVEDIYSDYFKYLLSHHDIAVKENGEEHVEQLISLFVIRALYPYLFNIDGYEQLDMKEIKNIMNTYLSADNIAFSYYDAVKARGENRVEDFISLLKEYGPKWQPEIWQYADVNLAPLIQRMPELKTIIEQYLNERMNSFEEASIKQSYKKALLMLENEGKGVKFEDCSFDEALVLAAKSGKLLFMDCYTSWCGPCKMLSDKIFPLKEVGDFFNQHFINIKMDMEKGEGKDLAKRYKVRSYPTLLVLDAKGNIVHRLSGARPPKDLLVLMARALSEETAYAPVKAKYEAGDRSPRVVVEYLLNMRLTGEMGEEMIQKKAEEYFQSLSDEQRLDKYMLYFFKNFASDPESDMALYFLKHRKSYDKIEQDMDPEELLLRIYFPALMNYLPEANLQDERLAHLIQVIKDAGYVKDKMTLGYLVNIIEAVGENNWKEVKKIYFKKVAKMTDMRGQLNLDVLWNRLWVKTPDSMKAEVIEYLKAEKAKTIEPSIDNYEMLLEKLQQ